MKTTSILLLLLAATTPLLAMNPCQVDCMAASHVTQAIVVHHGHHSGSNATHNGHPRFSISTATCGSHFTLALQSRFFVLSGPEKASQPSLLMAAVESLETAVVQAAAACRNHSEFVAFRSASATPLRI